MTIVMPRLAPRRLAAPQFLVAMQRRRRIRNRRAAPPAARDRVAAGDRARDARCFAASGVLCAIGAANLRAHSTAMNCFATRFAL
ncbi:hypothetical protein PRJ39_12935 [Lysobacter enzymogenes]|uniref:hypothetical protein n=1 Tax=Lysobacter enzymogenes TaxID=69 RepID=UPI00374A67A5